MGTVGSRSITFKAPDHAYLDRGCVLARPPCPPSGYTWGGATRPSAGVLAALIGGVTRSGTIIGLLRTTRLARPRNAERTDGAIAKGAALSVSGGTLTTTAGAGTLLAGKVTVRTTGSPRVSVTSCWARGTRHSVTTSTYGTVPPGALTTSLVARTRLTGTISGGTSGFGSFGRTTVR